MARLLLMARAFTDVGYARKQLLAHLFSKPPEDLLQPLLVLLLVDVPPPLIVVSATQLAVREDGHFLCVT